MCGSLRRIAVLGNRVTYITCCGNVTNGGIGISDHTIIERPYIPCTTGYGAHLLILIKPTIGLVGDSYITAEDISPQINASLTELIMIGTAIGINHGVQASHRTLQTCFKPQFIILVSTDGTTVRVAIQVFVRARKENSTCYYSPKGELDIIFHNCAHLLVVLLNIRIAV